MSEIAIGFLGDLRNLSNGGRRRPADAFVQCQRKLREQDILFANLEGVFSDVRDPEEERWASAAHHGRGSAADEMTEGPGGIDELDGYKAAGVHVVNNANNPSMTKGWKALQRCMELLDGAQIKHVGAGRNLAEARRPALLECNGIRVAFLGYTCVGSPVFAAGKDRGGVARIDIETSYRPHLRWNEVPGSPAVVLTQPKAEHAAWVADDVRRAKEQADVVAVSWHWGVSPATGGTGPLTDYQVELGHLCIDSGADVVVGHHPHMTQAIELYRGKAIYYSLGNFTPGHNRGHRPEPTFMARVVVRETGVQQYSYVPGHILANEEPVFLAPMEATHVINRVREMSTQFPGTGFVAQGDEVIITEEG